MLGRIARALLALVGAVAVVAGLTAAVYVGPDDDVLLPARRPGAEPGQLVVSAPDLLAYDDLTVVVRARAAGGVLLAAGNPVDVSSLADQVEHWEVTGVRFRGVTGGRRVAAARHPVPLGDLASADLWTERTEGAGWQELRLHLDGRPLQLLAQPAGGAVPELQVGVHLGGLFWLLVAVAAGGAGLLGLAVALMVRRRRGRGRAAGLLVPMLALAAVAAGCGGPQHVDAGPASRVALEPDDLATVLAAYDELNNRAIRAAAAPDYATKPWRAVDTGPVLEHDVYDTLVSRRTNERERPRPFTHAPVRAYSPRFTSYPMWSLVVSSVKRTTYVQVFTRETAASPWLMRTTNDADPEDLPDPIEDPGRMVAVDPRTADAARTAVGAVTRYLATGVLRGVRVTDSVRKLHRQANRVAAHERKLIHSQHLTVDSAAADPQDDLRIVAVEGGHLAVAVRPTRVTYIAPRGRSLRWNPAFAPLNGTFGQEIYREFNLCLVLFVPDDGTPRAIAATAIPTRA